MGESLVESPVMSNKVYEAYTSDQVNQAMTLFLGYLEDHCVNAKMKGVDDIHKVIAELRSVQRWQKGQRFNISGQIIGGEVDGNHLKVQWEGAFNVGLFATVLQVVGGEVMITILAPGTSFPGEISITISEI